MDRLLLKTLLAFVATGGLMFIATDADAHGRWRGRVGVYIGAPVVVSPWYRPWPYYAHPYSYPYYYPPVVREEPTVYIEQGVEGASSSPAPAPQAQAPAQQYWYYCQDSRTYYPHVQTCASPWQRVMPHTPAQ